MHGYDRPFFAHKHYWHAMQVFLGHEERIIETLGAYPHQEPHILKQR